MLAPRKEIYDKPRQYIKKQRHHLSRKVPRVKAIAFPIVMYGCDSWSIKKAEGQRIDVFNLWWWRLDGKEIKPVNHKGNQPSIFTGKIVAGA